MTTPTTHACPTCRRTFNLFAMTQTDARHARNIANIISARHEQIAKKALTATYTKVDGKFQSTPYPSL